MIDWFDHKGFDEYYLKSAKAANKVNLLNAFYAQWMEWFGPYNTIRTQTKGWVKANWTAKNKKGVKDRLLKYGYTSAQIDGLFKKFSEWIKLTCK